MTVFAIFIYSCALLLANLSAAIFGPWVTPVNSFVLIGLDLALRDLLHSKLRWWQMLFVIIGSGFASWLIFRDAGRIAIAGAVAFALAGVVDWIVFSKGRGSWEKRAHKSNFAGAAVDSLAFPLIAFGGLMPLIVIGQLSAKTIGAMVWIKIIKHLSKGEHQ